MTLPSYYLPPISWFVRLLQSDEPTLIEQWANYKKQTFHNRCYIDSPNGKLALTIPIDKCNFVGGKCLMKDVQISDHSDWQHQHWYALESSYFNSPFFEYLQDDFHPIYLKRWKWLMDLNEAVVDKCIGTLSISPCLGGGQPSGTVKIERTSEFMGAINGYNVQLDSLPKQGGPGRVYYQVFSQKHGFLPDLSIIDLIFNLGPESIIYLTNNLNFTHSKTVCAKDK